MAWGTRTIGLGEIARQRAAQVRDDVPVVIKGESVQTLKDVGFLDDEASLDGSRDVTIQMKRQEWEILDGRRRKKETNGELIIRLLREDESSWEEATRKVSKARARAKLAPKSDAEARSAKEAMIALAKEAVARRDP